MRALAVMPCTCMAMRPSADNHEVLGVVDVVLAGGLEGGRDRVVKARVAAHQHADRVDGLGQGDALAAGIFDGPQGGDLEQLLVVAPAGTAVAGEDPQAGAGVVG